MKNFKEILLKAYVDIFVDWKITYKFLIISKDKDKKLHNYIEQKAKELAEIENIKIFHVSFDELNTDEKDENSKAVGIFRYIKNEVSRSEYDGLISNIKKFRKIEDSEILPRIEISEIGDVFTILHELGHYFIYKRNQIQSEDSANLFIAEFFENYLPPFFKWIFQINIKVRTNKEREFSKCECYTFLKEYNKWEKNGI